MRGNGHEGAEGDLLFELAEFDFTELIKAYRWRTSISASVGRSSRSAGKSSGKTWNCGFTSNRKT